MNLTILERHEAGSSLLHQLDARVKVVTALLLITGIVVTPDAAWIAYPLLWTMVGLLAVVGQVSAWRLGRLAGLALPFALAAVTLLVTTPGHPVVNAGGLTVTDAGLARFVSIVLKSWLSVQVALLLTMTTPPLALLSALEGLRVPVTLVTIISFMYRYLFTLKDESERLLRARAARSGASSDSPSGGTLLWRARITGGMVGSLFLRSYERSERVYAAMLARGYDGQLKRQLMLPPDRRALVQGAIPVIIVILIQLIARHS